MHSILCPFVFPIPLFLTPLNSIADSYYLYSIKDVNEDQGFRI
jgi:hypothetical protein